MQRQVLEEELQRAKPPTDPHLDRAQAILEDFTGFWEAEPAKRRKLLLSLFAQIWAKDNQIVAVKPNPAFANYFTAASEVRATHPKADAGDEATNTGASGRAANLDGLLEQVLVALMEPIGRKARRRAVEAIKTGA